MVWRVLATNHEIRIWEDMSGRQGPLISPAHWEELMGPCYRRIREAARGHRIPLISVDTDGNPDLIIIPPMLANGVNMLFPMNEEIPSYPPWP